MIRAIEQEQDGFHAFRIAPPIVQTVMDPFLQISVVTQSKQSMARPQAGYTSVFIVLADSEGDLIIETGSIGKKVIPKGGAQALFCGRGVLCRLSVLGERVRYLHVDVKISERQELLDAQWRTIVGDRERGFSILDHHPSFSVSLSQHVPPFWHSQCDPIHFVGTQDGAQWDTKPFLFDKKYWYLQGIPLQEPVDYFSSLALSDRVRNRLALLAFRRGELGALL